LAVIKASKANRASRSRTHAAPCLERRTLCCKARVKTRPIAAMTSLPRKANWLPSSAASVQI
jgi:hypothetical protein